MKNFETVIFVMQILFFTVRVHAGRTLGLIFHNYTQWELLESDNYNLAKTIDGGTVIIGNDTMRAFQIYAEHKTETYNWNQMMDIIQAKHLEHPIEVEVPINDIFREFGKITNIEHIDIDGFVASWKFTFTWNMDRTSWAPVVLDEKYYGFGAVKDEQVVLIESMEDINGIKDLLAQPSCEGLLVQFANHDGKVEVSKYRLHFEASTVKLAVAEKYYDKYKLIINHLKSVTVVV